MDTANSLRDEPSVDGRTARRLANRERILDAALELVAKGVELDFDDIARSAAVSVRSIYNHFPTARHLVAGMYERGIARMRHFIDDLPTASVPFDQRVKRWVRTWARMQEELAPIRWQALVAEDRHPELQPELAELRKAHLVQIERTFPEITRTHARAAAAAATDSLTWRVLRRHQGLGFDTACSVVEETLRRLAGDRDAPSAPAKKESG